MNAPEIPLWLTALNAAVVPFCIYVGIRCLRSGYTFIAVLNFSAAACIPGCATVYMTVNDA